MSDLNFNIYNILIFAGILQGLVFSIVVLFNKKFSSFTNNFIVFTVLALSFSNFQYWIDDIDLKGWLDVFVDLRIPCDMLIVPFFYLFVNSYLQNKISKKIIALLLTPFFISLFFNLILFLKLFYSENIFRTVNIVLESFSFLFNLILIGVIIHQVKNYQRLNKQYSKMKVRAETKWIKQILYIGGIMCLFWFVTIIIMQTKYNSGLSIYYPLWISISVLVYWISYVGIINSKINSERVVIRNTVIKEETINSSNNNVNNELSDNIASWIKESKVYLNPDLSLNLIAKEFNISKGYLSQLLNSNNDLNFNDFVNSYRVEKVKEMIKMKNTMTTKFYH